MKSYIDGPQKRFGFTQGYNSWTINQKRYVASKQMKFRAHKMQRSPRCGNGITRVDIRMFHSKIDTIRSAHLRLN